MSFADDLTEPRDDIPRTLLLDAVSDANAAIYRASQTGCPIDAALAVLATRRVGRVAEDVRRRDTAKEI